MCTGVEPCFSFKPINMQEAMLKSVLCCIASKFYNG